MVKGTTFWIGMIVILLVVGGFFVFSGGRAEDSKIVQQNSNAQIVKMHVEGSQYVLEPSSVKKGIPVRLEADILRMPGCSKSFVISEFGVRKVFSSGNNAVEFTPNKAGTFYIACSMNMYKGSLTVLESNGAKSAYVQAEPEDSGATCGVGGGCGCGG